MSTPALEINLPCADQTAPSILTLLRLNEVQRHAATTPGNLLVTAGAGSGKTRTLVGRYLALLEQGASLRSIAAITFTDKAAREMRNRIRATVTDWLAQAPQQRAFWEAVFSDLDAARVGTVHSLCSQILRAHPVEAARLGVMPGFGVLEEGRAAVLRARAIEDALAWAVSDPAASRLFGQMSEFELRAALSSLLEKRLDADPSFAALSDDPLQGWGQALHDWLSQHMASLTWQSPLDVLTSLRADDPNDRMEVARQEVLAHARTAVAALARADFSVALAELAATCAATALQGRKGCWPGDTLAEAKDAMRAVRDGFEAHLKPLADPQKMVAWEMDEQAAGLVWPLYQVYLRTKALYTQAKQADNALDFDDLEAGALELLHDEGVRATWQSNVQAVLVDEFQDTNERQRQIVYALSNVNPTRPGGQPAAAGGLFVVGDAKQSIYRFRGADVTVFRRVQADIERNGGQVISLDLTFRAHHALVENTNRLLSPILGATGANGQESADEAIKRRPYEVPFAPLRAQRAAPRPGLNGPFVELLLGLGESADDGRQAAAAGLAARLLELHGNEGLAWQDMALLFRASTSFPVYEEALERADIPFVTVAGRGFYERSEIRDLLNALVAVADPSDDLAMAGLLRSPAIGLSDAALYLLRFPPQAVLPRPDHKPCALWVMLNHAILPKLLPPDEVERAVRGREMIRQLHRQAGRAPVAALLKQWLDQTDYRAALRMVGGGARTQRNIDKLLADAHTSQLVSVREFIEYVRTLQGVGARESEAPTEAGQAVQLMTVHKSKGLEFPLTVIADAAHSGHIRANAILLDRQLGVTLAVHDDDKRRPAAHQLAALRDAERDEAEDRRLLYVAATRAQEKLLVSAHTKILKGGKLMLAGWLKRLGEVVGLDEASIPGTPLQPYPLPLAEDLTCVLYPWQGPTGQVAARPSGSAGADSPSHPANQDLVAPLAAVPPGDCDPKLAAREAEPPPRVWRVIPVTRQPEAPAWVVGTLVHTALRYWRFDDGLPAFLQPVALELGVIDEQERYASIHAAQRLLQRFRAHPLWAELDVAQRWHEVPFSLLEGGQTQSGVLDLLCRLGDDWRVIEFKTDELRAGDDALAHARAHGYDEQVHRYKRAVQAQLGVLPQASLVFLNAGDALVTLLI